MLTWLSADMQRRTGIRNSCLAGQAQTPLSHDNLFHSVLGLMDVNTRAYNPALDLFRACAS